MVDPTKPDGAALRPRPPYSRRQIISQVGIAAVILISGMGIGTGGTILVLKDRIMWRFMPLPPPGPDVNEIVQRWQTDYSLTDEQASQAREAFIASQSNTRKLFAESWQKQMGEQAKFVKVMGTILKPEQFQKFKSDLDERAKHFRHQRPGWRPGWRQGGPGGPGGPPGERDGNRKDRGPFRGERRGFRPPPGHEPPPGEKGVLLEPNLPGEPGPGPKPE
jgi:hypothetical protein